MIYNTDLGW